MQPVLERHDGRPVPSNFVHYDDVEAKDEFQPANLDAAQCRELIYSIQLEKITNKVIIQYRLSNQVPFLIMNRCCNVHGLKCMPLFMYNKLCPCFKTAFRMMVLDLEKLTTRQLRSKLSILLEDGTSRERLKAIQAERNRKLRMDGEVCCQRNTLSQNCSFMG